MEIMQASIEKLQENPRKPSQAYRPIARGSLSRENFKNILINWDDAEFITALIFKSDFFTDLNLFIRKLECFKYA